VAASGTPGARRRSVGRAGLGALAVAAAGVIAGAAYGLATPPLAPYAPVRLGGGWFLLVALACGAAVAIGLQQPRAGLAAAVPVSAVAGGLVGLVLVLPVFTDDELNAVGLTNYAMTQGAFAFFLLLPVVFLGASLGLVIAYLWQERRS
jgi:hypothetical protein